MDALHTHTRVQLSGTVLQVIKMQMIRLKWTHKELKVCLTYTRQWKPHLVHFDLVYERHTHTVGQHHERRDNVHNGILRQRTRKEHNRWLHRLVKLVEMKQLGAFFFKLETNLKAGVSKRLVAPVQLISSVWREKKKKQ